MRKMLIEPLKCLCEWAAIQYLKGVVLVQCLVLMNGDRVHFSLFTCGLCMLMHPWIRFLMEFSWLHNVRPSDHPIKLKGAVLLTVKGESKLACTKRKTKTCMMLLDSIGLFYSIGRCKHFSHCDLKWEKCRPLLFSQITSIKSSLLWSILVAWWTQSEQRLVKYFWWFMWWHIVILCTSSCC